LSETGPPGGGRPQRWRVLLATALGAAHAAAGRPLQDAIARAGDPADGPFAVAVADGHGHPRHARSARGAALAVSVATAAGVEHASRLAAATSAPAACAAARGGLVPELIRQWQQAVAADLAGHPVAAAEAAQLRPGDGQVVLYGTTLLLAVAAGPWLVLCQIGDGDIVVVDSAGLAHLPVPGDSRLDGWRTTSLCEMDAHESFRCGAVDLGRQQVAAVLLATDGYGNAQAADPWQQPVGADLVTFARERGIAWMREQLPLWVSMCASAEGSADDTAVALLLSEDILKVPTVPTEDPGLSRA
jgi:hypothetical protein